MFTWICPQCGREVPPAYNECPDCSAKTAQGNPPAASAGSPVGTAAPPQPSPDPEPPPAFTPPPETPAPPAFRPAQASSPLFQPSPPVAPQVRYAPPRRGGTQVPTWLMALIFAALFVGLGGGVFWLLNRNHDVTPSAVVESPAAKPGAAANPLQKFIEITGVRFGPSSKGLVVTFLVVNHSSSDLVGLTGNATVWGRTQKSEEDSVGTFTFQTSMPANSSKELTMPFTTKLKLADVPEWQNLTVDVQVTAPTGA